VRQHLGIVVENSVPTERDWRFRRTFGSTGVPCVVCLNLGNESTACTHGVEMIARAGASRGLRRMTGAALLCIVEALFRCA